VVVELPYFTPEWQLPERAEAHCTLSVACCQYLPAVVEAGGEWNIQETFSESSWDTFRNAAFPHGQDCVNNCLYLTPDNAAFLAN
jgi:hypothetical protein